MKPKSKQLVVVISSLVSGAEQMFCLIINILSHNKTIVAVNATSNMIGHITPNACFQIGYMLKITNNLKP